MTKHSLRPRPAAIRAGAMFLFVTITGAHTLAAQEPGREQDRQNPPLTKREGTNPQTAYASIDRMVGAPVFLQASAEAVAEANREGEAVDRPKAKVDEWLVDCRDGSLSHAVVSFGGFLGMGDKTVLVPAKELTWNDAMERYDLGWRTDELKAKPSFDLDAACKTGLDAACGVKHTGADHVDASGKTGDGTKVAADASLDGTSFRRPTDCLCKASEVAKLPVYAGAKEWGKAQDLVVDRGQGKVVLAIVNHGATLGVGGTDYLVPFGNLMTAVKDGDDRILAARDAAQTKLESCVEYVKPKNGIVEPDAAARALERVKAERKDTRQG